MPLPKDVYFNSGAILLPSRANLTVRTVDAKRGTKEAPIRVNSQALCEKRHAIKEQLTVTMNSMIR